MNTVLKVAKQLVAAQTALASLSAADKKFAAATAKLLLKGAGVVTVKRRKRRVAKKAAKAVKAAAPKAKAAKKPSALDALSKKSALAAAEAKPEATA